MSKITVVSQGAYVMKHNSTILTTLSICLVMLLAGASSAQQQNAQPLSLEECILVALHNNPEIISSQQDIISARAGLTRARSSYYPQLSLNASEGITSSRTGASLGAGNSGSDWRDELDLRLSMTLWRSGRSDNVAENRLGLRTAELSHLNMMQVLAEQVATDYYAVLASQELVAVAEAGVESAQQHLQDVKTRIRLGAAAEVDIFAVEDDLARAQLDLIDARSGVRLALARLKFTMGVPYTTDLHIAPVPLGMEEALPSLPDAVNSATEKRPDVLASRITIRAREYALAQAKMRRGPILELGGQYDQSYTDWDANDDSWNVLATASWPLFDGQATKADETSARAGVRRSEADQQRLLNQVALEVENALVEIDRTSERMKAAEKSVAAAQAHLRGAEAKYRQGVGILLEVTDARAALTSAAANQVRARFDYQVALVALQRATGMLSLPAQPPRQSND